MSASGEFGSFFDDERRRRILRATFEAYHADAPEHGIVFDTNRVWSGRAALLADLFPDMRIICCVRSVGWIIDSIERLLRKNPLEVARFVGAKSGSTIYSRVDALMNSDTGLVGSAWSHLRELWFGNFAERALLVEYDAFVKNPGRALEGIYRALGETAFAHDFENVAYQAPAFDADFGVPGLHTVRPRVEARSREPCIPPDIIAKYADSDFWRTPRRTRAGPTIIC